MYIKKRCVFDKAANISILCFCVSAFDWLIGWFTGKLVKKKMLLATFALPNARDLKNDSSAHYTFFKSVNM